MPDPIPEDIVVVKAVLRPLLGATDSFQDGWPAPPRDVSGRLQEMVAMGRSFLSVRMGVKDVTARWMQAGKELRAEDRPYAEKLADLSKRHAAETFYGFDDPLEAALFSVLIEILKALEGKDVDP